MAAGVAPRPSSSERTPVENQVDADPAEGDRQHLTDGVKVGAGEIVGGHADRAVRARGERQSERAGLHRRPAQDRCHPVLVAREREGLGERQRIGVSQGVTLRNGGGARKQTTMFMPRLRGGRRRGRGRSPPRVRRRPPRLGLSRERRPRARPARRRPLPRSRRHGRAVFPARGARRLRRQSGPRGRRPP